MKHRTLIICTGLIFLAAMTFSCREPSISLDQNGADQLIRSFSLNTNENPVLSADITAEIQGSTIFLQLPYGTDRTALTPRFEIAGKGLQVDGLWQQSGSSVQDFSSPVYYDLVKTDNSRIQYSVIAGYDYNNGTNWFDFSFQSGSNVNLNSSVNGAINGETIRFSFPFETTIQPMIPSFGTPTGAVVYYNGIILNNGAAPLINPAGGGTIRVDFADGTSEVYTVESTVEEQKYIHVSPTGSPGASGSQSNPLNTIEDAVSAAQSKGIREIRVATGSYTLSTNLLIQNDISIRGGYYASDWSSRSYTSPDIRNGSPTDINISSGTSGTADEHMGSIVYEGTGVGSSTILEGLRVYGMAGASNFTAAVKVLNGASPTIQYCDLNGASVNDSSALSVYNAAPRIYSSQILGNASGYSVGLNIGYNAQPAIISSYISSGSATTPADGIALQLAGPDAGGYFYNNYIEGKGSSQAAAVRLSEPGGTFINNMFSIVGGMPWDICFWEDGSGNSPDLLENNNFSTGDLGVPLYMKDGITSLNKAFEINALDAASGNSDYFFYNFYSYISDSYSQYIPSAVAYKGQSLTGIWFYDLYGNSRSDSNSWSRGPYETDYTVLAEEYLSVSDMSSDMYDGYWYPLSLREAVHLTNTQEESTIVIFPDMAPTVFLNSPLIVSSDLYLVCSDASLTLDGSNINRHFIIDNSDPGSQSEVYIQGVTFNNAYDGVEGGSIFNLENLYLYDCSFNDNDAPRGGAVYTRQGTLLIANTVFTLNEATFDHGGAIYVLDSVLNAHNLVFALNFTSGSTSYSVGSSIYAENSTVRISFSTFFDNEAMNEAAVYGKNSTIQVLSSIFDSNTNVVAGPPDETDVYSDGGSLDLRGSIVETTAYGALADVDPGPPGFLDPVNPDGGDGWKDANDGLHALDNGQIMVDHGFEDAIPADWPDADGDGDTSEPFPYDIKKTQRVLGASPDAGAYESY